MSRTAAVPAQLRHLPFRGRDAVQAGLLSRRQLTGPAWRRLLPDIYVHSGAPVDHRAWCVAGALLLPPGGAIGGASAAYLYGADVLTLDAPVELCLPLGARLRPHPHMVVRRASLDAHDVRRVGGLPATTPVRTAFDLSRGPDLVEAVVGVDALVYRRAVRLDGLRAYASARPRWPGAGRAARVLSLARAGVESPMETRVRLICVLGGLPCPVVQYEVFDGRGQFVARLDLAYPELKLGVEYDGDHHRERATFRRDAARLNALRAVGWSVLRFTADDVRHHPERIVAQIRAAAGHEWNATYRMEWR